MSPKFLFYLHRRIFLEKYGRPEMIDILARKTLKSIARSTGGRLASNKWLRAIEWLFRSTGSTPSHYDPELEGFVLEFTAALQRYQSTHAVSVGRVLLVLDYLKFKVTDGVQTFAGRLHTHQESFTQRTDVAFLNDALSSFSISIASCGHPVSSYHSGMEPALLVGNAERHDHHSTVCTHCADQLINSGQRVLWRNREYLLREYAVQVLSNGDSYFGDRRNPRFTFNERYQRWVDGTWSPYTNIIDNYHSSRSRGFHIIESPWFKRHRRAFGLELEIQNANRNSMSTNTAAGKVHEVLNPSLERGEYCYFERDGSIGEGFELITQPAGLDVHREKLALFLNNPDLKKGLRSHEGGNCGLHIHVGRQFLTQAQIYRIQSFLNDVRNEGLVRKVSRRYSNSYARIKHEMAKLSPIGKHSNERYEALNVTNRETVEFRIFRGSLRYESVMAALEFVDSLLTFCMPGQTSIMDFNAIGFRKYVTKPENAEDTKYLRTYLSLNSTNDDEQVIALAA